MARPTTKSKRKQAPKETVLNLPDLEQSKSAVLNRVVGWTHIKDIRPPLCGIAAW